VKTAPPQLKKTEKLWKEEKAAMFLYLVTKKPLI